MRNKIIYGVLALVVLLGAFFFWQGGGDDSAKTDGPIKIGFMLPLSGPFAGIGEGIRNAGLMAVEEYNASNPGAVVEVVEEDDGFDVLKGIPAYNKLTDLDRVDGIMMISTPIIDALHVQMKEDGLPIVSVGLQNEGVAPDNIFQTTLAPIAPIEFLAEAVEAKGYAKTAVVYTTSLAAIIGFQEAFVNSYNLPQTSFVVTDAQSARVAATKIISDGFDAVVILQDAVGGPLVTRELKALDTNNRLSYYYDLQLSTAWSEYEKVIGDTTRLNGASTLRMIGGDTADFAKKYKDKYGVEPTPFAEYGYDSARVLLASYHKDQKKWLANIQASSMTGPSGDITFDSNGIRIQEVELVKVEGGKVPQ